MSERTIQKLFWVLALGSCALQAREIRTPLVLYRGELHYPLDRNTVIENCYDLMVDVWGAGYSTSALNAFWHGKSTEACNPNNLVDVSQLLFGKPEFTLAQSFAGSTTGTTLSSNPFVSLSVIAPRFEYNEQGAFFGLNVAKRFGCDNEWQAGVRLKLPYRDLAMRQQCDSITGAAADANESLANFYQVRQETNTFSGTPETNSVFAARLDFLSTLKRIAYDSTGGSENLVIYSDTAGKFTIGDQAMAGGLSSAQAPVNNAPFAAAIKTNDGVIPATVRWGDTPQSSATVINPDGSGLSNLQRGRFVTDNNYTPLGNDTVAQAQLWIVPNVDPSTGVLAQPGASTLATEIAQAVNAISATASLNNFLIKNGISFCTGSHNKGIGDFDMEWFAGYQPCADYWVEGQFGIRLPTGKQLFDPLLLTRLPLGNDGHVEIRPGIAAGFERWSSIKLHAHATYSFVLNRIEHLPASFTGATITNIGPDVPGSVNWGYFWGNLVATFLHPRNEAMGFSIAYELYAKSSDNIKFCVQEATDFAGVVKQLDATVLEKNTHRVANRISGEIFCAAHYCDLFAGFSQVVAGENIPQETDMYIGLRVTF